MAFLQASWDYAHRVGIAEYIVIGFFIFGVFLLFGTVYGLLHASNRRQHNSKRN